MINYWLKINLSIILFFILLCQSRSSIFLSPTKVFADEFRQGRFFFGGDLGAAQTDLQRGDIEYDGTWLYGALRAEYALSEQLLLGVEGAGWTDQKNMNSSISEDVLTFMITARVYPLLESGVFVKTGWGYVKHRYWESSASSDASGTGYLVGLGYELDLGPLIMSYSRGDLDQETYEALTFSVGFTF
jgi:hypothetical protein